MENNSDPNWLWTQGMIHALKVAVTAIAATHPERDQLKAALSDLYSSLAAQDNPVARSPEATEGWNSVVRSLQSVLGGFPVLTESGQAHQRL